MKKNIGLNVDGVLCADGKTYWISDFSRKSLQAKGFKGAYLSQVGGFNAVVYKNNRQPDGRNMAIRLQQTEMASFTA